jgi:hypothetical protein
MYEAWAKFYAWMYPCPHQTVSSTMVAVRANGKRVALGDASEQTEHMSFNAGGALMFLIWDATGCTRTNCEVAPGTLIDVQRSVALSYLYIYIYRYIYI